MAAKIYVGNILYEVTDADLQQLFAPYGVVVSAEVVKYKKSKRSKGFGYVKMEDADAAQNAIQSMNGQDYKGRKLFLELARSSDPTADVEQATNAVAAVQSEQAQESFTALEQTQEQQEHHQQQEEQNYTPHAGLQNSGTIFDSSKN